MSETEDDDGGIDKEALREELREKYEEDDAEREATQRMSDLLLKGATMTNSHCNTCGDPLFQQNGTTFCPTCHGGPEGVDAQANVANQENGGQGQQPAGATAQSGADGADTQRRPGATDAEESDAGPQPSGSPADEPPATASLPSEAHEFDPETSPTNPDGRSAPEPAGRQSRQPHDSGRRGPSETPARSSPTPPATGDVDEAADSLQAALERFAREAATTDDPRYARDCLEAAHEAADALAALRR